MADDVQGHMRVPADAIDTTSAQGLNLHCDAAVQLQQQALAQLQMPGLGIGFGLELMQQRAERLEELPSLAMESQLPVGPLP